MVLSVGSDLPVSLPLHQAPDQAGHRLGIQVHASSELQGPAALFFLCMHWCSSSASSPDASQLPCSGYINFSSVYIGWLCGAVFLHLPSLKSLGLDFRTDVSVLLTLFLLSLLVRLRSTPYCRYTQQATMQAGILAIGSVSP